MSYGYQFITDPKFINRKDQGPEGPSSPIPSRNNDGGDKRPFRFSIFGRFQREFLQGHLETIKANKDINLLVYILHTFILNNSLQAEAILGMVYFLAENLKEQDLLVMGESRLGNLARSLKLLLLNNNGELAQNKTLVDFEAQVSRIFVSRYSQRVENNKERQQQNSNDDDQEGDGHVVSKENLALRETLGQMGIAFEEEKLLNDAIFKTDFYIPSAKLAIEINGKSHFYPYTTRFNNFTNMKNKVVRGVGHNILNLNSWTLEGMLKDEERKGLKDLLQKTIKTYQDKQ